MSITVILYSITVINCEAMKPGVYFIQIDDEIVQKVVKVR